MYIMSMRYSGYSLLKDRIIPDDATVHDVIEYCTP